MGGLPESVSESVTAWWEGGDMGYANFGVGHSCARVPNVAQVAWVLVLVA